MKKVSVFTAIVCVFISCVVSAEAISVRGIDLEFVTIGEPGNAGDTRSTANPHGCGAVGYAYQIGKYEITANQWQVINNSANIDNNWHWSGNQPAADISWFDAARFCNYLTTGDTENGVYTFTNGTLTSIKNHQTAGSMYEKAYFLPTEDEWYKAAYYTGSGYSTYANGQESIPAADNGWNYYGGSYSSPWGVGTGTMEQNGTYDMMGNVWELTETSIGDSVIRGGCYDNGVHSLVSSIRVDAVPPDSDGIRRGFRVASVPEPATLSLLGLGGVALLRKRK